MLFSDSDPIFTPEAAERLAARIPGAGPAEIVAGAGHFLQEEKGEEIAERIVRFLAERLGRHGPGVAGVEQRLEIALARLLARRLELLAHQVVVDRALDAPEDTERHRAVGLDR